jgi:hypothetical protein
MNDAAELIAQGNWDLDHGVLSATHSVPFFACLFRDAGASRQVRNNHFPTFSDVPDVPRRREVVAGAKAAQNRADRYAGQKLKAGFTLEHKDYLTEFGQALHPLQDSWSHQGIPDIPFLCDENLAWAHPAPRGGWKSHRADITHQWNKDLLQAAKTSYELMMIALKNNSWASGGSPATWSSLEPEVDAFAKARTKTEKDQWFKKRGFSQTEFLANISIPDGKQRFNHITKEIRDRVLKPLTQLPSLPKVSSDVVAFLNKFVTEWLTTTNFIGVVDNYIDRGRFATRMRYDGSVDNQRAIMANLRMWRVADHGLVENLGHGDPNRGSLAQLSDTVENPKRYIRYKSTTSALVPFGEPNGPRFLLVPGQGQRYTALLQFRHTPNDVVAIGVDRVADKWQTDLISWLVQH